MNMRSSRSTVRFSAPFSLSRYSGELPAGDYEIVVEEELLQGLSFEAWRRIATYLTVHGKGPRVGQTEMRAITESELNDALSQARSANRNNNDNEAALFPQEDLK